MQNPPAMIYVMHLKPQYLSEIERQIVALDHRNIEFLKEGEVLSF